MTFKPDELRRSIGSTGRTGLAAAVLSASILATAFLSSPVWAAGIVGVRAAQNVPALASDAAGPQAPAHAGSPSQPAVPQVSLAEATAARLETAGDTATITFELTHSVEASAFVMADPDRVIVDLPQIDFTLDSDIGRPTRPTRRHAHRSGLVASYRFGLLAPGRSRIVVDLGAPARLVHAGVEKSGDVYRLVIALAKTDGASFRAAARSHTLDMTATASIVPVQPVALASDKPTVVIDPGHGGPDTGAIVNGVIEKGIALSFAQSLAHKLEATGTFNVVMTRSTDVFIPLSERVRIAREAKAALMISIHADTLVESSDVSGTTIYTVSDKASDAEAAKVAAKENESDAAAGADGQGDKADVSDILFDLTRQETRAYSHVFARTFVNYWKVAGRLNKNPQRSAGFRVLKAPDVPSVLVELGYLSNAEDVKALTSEQWRDMASGKMAAAVIAYFADQRGPEKAAAGIVMADPAGALRQASAGADPAK